MRITIERRTMSPPVRGTKLPAIAVLGAADIGVFLWRRRHTLLSQSSSRAGGAAAGLGLWSALGVSSGISAWRPSSRRWRRATVGLGLICGAGNLALLVAHLRVHKGGIRSLPGTGLGLAALASAWRWRRTDPRR
jgi:hypothetical protein